MKRRYIIAPACLAVSFTLLLAACSSTGPSASTPTPAQPSATPETVVESPSASSDAQALFTAGTWLSDGGQYYFFDGDGASGRTASLEDGTGVGFAYTVDGTQAVFAMGGADNESPCTVSRDGDAITLEEAAQTHIERDFMVYWFEKFRGGDLEDAAFRRRVIDSFVNAVYLWDDRLRVAFNYSGKGSAVDMELVMDAEALAGPEGRFVLAPPASTINHQKISRFYGDFSFFRNNIK